MAEERGRTLEEIESLPFSAEAVCDLYELWARVQGVVNAYAVEQDRMFDPRVLLTLMRLMGDEVGRVMVRNAALDSNFS